jgi:hypothetical protein
MSAVRQLTMTESSLTGRRIVPARRVAKDG